MNRIWTSRELEQMLEPNDWMRLQEQVRSRASGLEPIPTAVKSRLQPLENVRGALFDIYGTLMISAAGEILSSQVSDGRPEDAAKSLELQLDQQVLDCLPKLLRTSLHNEFHPAQLLKHAVLQSLEELKSPSLEYPEVDIVSLWHKIFLQHLNEDMHSSLSPFILARFIIEYELLHNSVQLMPGTLELLHWLAARNFYIGIISNAQFYTPIIFSALLKLNDLADVNILPELCFWSYRAGMSKPQVEFFQAACDALKDHSLEPKEVLYLGNDMRNDIWGAKQVGFLTALFAGDQRSLRLRKEMSEVPAIEPDITITDLDQMKSVF